MVADPEWPLWADLSRCSIPQAMTVYGEFGVKLYLETGRSIGPASCAKCSLGEPVPVGRKVETPVVTSRSTECPLSGTPQPHHQTVLA
ncbi:MAG: hypothetical protein ACI9W6_000814 [Motiliproteus sp.]|jgi:hypothetical protein